MMRRLLGAIVVIAVLGIAVNDIWRVFDAESHLRGVTYDLTKWAAENVHDLPRDQAAAKILADAQAQGVTLYAYDQTEKAVRVYTSQEVHGTVVAGPVYNMLAGASFAEAISSPLTIRDHRDAGFAR